MAFALDLGLSIGFQLLAPLLKPRKVNTTNDNYPTQQFGEVIPKAFGNTLIRGVLTFAGDPNLNNRVQIDAKTFNNPSENASYAVFLHSNPSNPIIDVIRINGLIVATRLPQSFPLTNEIKNLKITDGLGLLRFDQFTPRFYNGTQTTADPMFVRNGSADIVYEKQCYLVIADAIRNIYGGRGASVGVVVRDWITSTSTVPAAPLGFNDAPATIRWSFSTASLFSPLFASLIQRDLLLPRGFQFTQLCAVFEGAASIGVNGAQSSQFAFGTGTQHRLEDSISATPTVVAAAYTVGNTSGPAGSTLRLSYPTVTPLPVVNTASILVASRLNEVRTITLSSPSNGPFYSVNGTIYNAVNAVVGSCGLSESVVGWANTMYTRSPSTANNTSNTQPPDSYTDLETIITGILSDSPLPYTFAPGFNKPVSGFVTTNKDISADLSNLLAVFNRIIYQKRNGEFVFAPYPAVPLAPIEIQPSAHINDPEIKLEPYESLPDALDFSFKDISREFDTASVRVGGDTGRIQSYSLDISGSAIEGLKMATVLLNRIRSQTVSGSLHLVPEFNAIEPGDVVRLKGLNPTSSDLLIIILRAETGLDGTVRMEFINHAIIDENPNVQVNVGSVGGVLTTDNTQTFVLDTEKRSDRVGLGYQTDNSSSVRRGNTVENSIVSSLRGIVTAITATTATVRVSGGSPVVGSEYYLLHTVTGEGSWIKVNTSTLTAPETYNLTISQGLYGSNSYTTASDLAFFQLAEESVINDSYTNLNLNQGGVQYTHTFSTRKRLVQPRLAGYLITANGIRFYRRDSWVGDDLDLSNGTNTTTYWKITNTTTLQTQIVTSNNAWVETTGTFTALSGQTITVQEVNSVGLSPTGAYVNTYSL